MDQAFVKAFARRNRSLRDQPRGAPSAVPTSAESQAVGSRPPRQVAPNNDEPGSLQVDRSVASTTEIWVDPIEDQIARADQAASEVPKPHVDSPPEPTVVSPPMPKVASEPEPTVASEPGPTDVPEPAATVEPQGEPRLAARPAPIAGPTVEGRVEPVVEQSAPPTSEGDQKADDPWQHVHTAYATAFADPSMGSSQAAVVTEPVDVQTPASRPAAAQASTQPITHAPPRTPITDGGQGPADVIAARRIDPPESRPGSPPAIVPFQAVWEVDVFDVPTLIADLFFEGSLFQQIAERMSNAVSSGLSSVLLTSAKSGEGRSSVAIGMAMAAAASGIRVALVDADTEKPTLADDLRLDLQYGWVDTVRGGLPIKEVAVHAVEDGVTLIPLMPPHGQTAATAFEVVQLIDLLKNKFELVIIDGPTGRSPNIHQCATAVDSAIIVRDVNRTDTLSLNELSYRLRESGVQGIGVVENFT